MDRAKSTIKQLMVNFLTTGKSIWAILIAAGFIALTSFGMIGGVLAAVMPEKVFKVVEPVVCAPGSAMRYDEFYDGYSTQVRIFCVEDASGIEKERTILFLGVVLGVAFLGIFWAVWGVLMLLRAIVKKVLLEHEEGVKAQR